MASLDLPNRSDNKWSDRIAKHRKHGRHHKKLASTSINNIVFVNKRWKGFCTEAKLGDPQTALLEGDPAIFKVFFEWMVENPDRWAPQVVSLKSYFRRLRQEYHRGHGEALDKSIAMDVNDYIDSHLKGKSESGPRSKPVLSEQDFVKLLHFHYQADHSEFPDGRQFIQQAALMIFHFLTGVRPSTTTKTTRSPDDPDAAKLCYRHFEFSIDRDDDGSQCFGVRPLFTRFKNETNYKQRKKFTWYDEGDMLICPVAHLMALAIHDRAFKLDRFNNVHSLLTAKLPEKAERIILRWKDECKDRPLFRSSSPSSPDRELTASTALKRLQRLGINFGLQDRLAWYCLRRGLLNAVAGVVSEDDLIKIAGHRRRETYETHYANHNINIDIQSIVKGLPPRNSRIARLSSMGVGADPKANSTLTAEDHEHINSLQDVREIQSAIDEAIAKSSSLQPEQSELKRQLLALREDRRRQLRARKQFHRSRLLASRRKEHFDRKDEEVIIHGSNDDNSTSETEPAAGFESDRAARKTFESTERSLLAGIDTKDDIRLPALLVQRVQAIQAMVDLCSQVQIRRKDRTKALKMEVMAKSESPTEQAAAGLSLKCHKLTCLFCPTLGQFGREQALWRHARMHLDDPRNYDQDGRIKCPHPICYPQGLTFSGREHLLNHALFVHGVRMAVR